MNTAEERVLEHALGEVFGAPPSDLPQRVLLQLRGNPPAIQRRSRRVALALVAAGLGLAVLWVGAFLRGSEEPGGEWVAVAEEHLKTLRPLDPTWHEQVAFRPGETVVNGPQRERHVRLASGGRVTLGRCSMVTLEQDDQGLVVVPRIGRTTVETVGSTGVRLRTPVGRVALGAQSTARVELLARGYDLEHPERFQELAEDIHMNQALPTITTLATLLVGAATLETAAGPRPLQEGETVQRETEDVSTELVRSKLMEEVGQWKLTVTGIGADGSRGAVLEGREVCRAGPGNRWLLTEMVLPRGGREVAMHTVLGYDPRHKSFTGSLVDSFGGELGLLRGAPTSDPDQRTIEMYSARETPGFDVRWRMSWESPQRRRTLVEVKQGEEWVVIQEIVHERQEKGTSRR